ncbi:hypothetical protein KY284_005332 [Solanum tuberosum]|nr:hypothetical protein KY284_005332 [Solanum tuberosum]
MAPNPPSPKEFPRPCRCVIWIGRRGLVFLALDYPTYPQPELTIGTNKHFDNDFLTVLLQDHIGGLQMLHQNQWVDVHPTRGALVINIGDLLQASITFLFYPSTIDKSEYTICLF